MGRKAKAEKEVRQTAAFLSGFNDECEDMDGIAMSSPAPKFWLPSGNYVINKILSGSYTKGFPTGRIACLAGPSGAGKSFLIGNAIKSALLAKDQEWGVLAIDSENALDDDYLTKIGANAVDNPLYNYRGISTISQCVNIVSKFIKRYREAEEEMPFLIAIDSLDNLMTDSEYKQYEEKGEMSGDQGQHAKQTKAMLKRFVNDLKGTNISMVVVKQVFKEQDKIAALQNPWVLTDSVKFAFSQIALVTKLQLKDKKTGIFEGIRLKIKGEKTRFCKPFQQGTIEVPYDAGMDPYTGILAAAVSLGVVTENKPWYEFEGKKFMDNDSFDPYKEAVFAKILEKDSEVLNVAIEDEEDFSEAMTAKEAEKKRKTRGEVDLTTNDE